jgi:iron(III) transport system permease protein
VSSPVAVPAQALLRWLPAAALGAVLALLVLPPLAVLLQISLTDAQGNATVANFSRLFADPRLYVSALNSVIFAASATLLSVAIGSCLAWLVERTNTPLRGLMHLVAIVSLGMPYILYVDAWLFLFGRSGPFNQLLQAVFGPQAPLLNVYSLWGIVLVEGLLWSPLVFLLLAPQFRRANADFEEAARICGASVAHTVARISLRLAMPAITGVALFVFIRNIESFDVPVLIGMPGRVPLLTTGIYQDMTQIPPQLGHASAFSVLLMLLVAVLLAFYGRLNRHAERFATVTGKAFRPRRFELGRWRWLGTALILAVFAIVLVLPLSALVWTSLLPFVRPFGLRDLHLLGFANYRAVFGDTEWTGLALNTLLAAAGAATAAMLLTGLAGWLTVRRRPGWGLLDQLTTLPLVFPGVVLGIAVLELALRAPVPAYGTLWTLSAAFLIRYMPYGMRYASSGVLQIHRELEEAATVAGASQPAVLRRIVAPLLAPAMLTGWLFIFLLGAKELALAVLLAGPNSQVIAGALFNAMVNGQAGEVAALGIVWIAVLSCCAGLMQKLASRGQHAA